MAGVADEVLVAPAASPDHKRKIQDLEPEAPETTPAVDEGDQEVAAAASESPDCKRPRLDDNVDVSANGNGYQEKKLDEPQEGENEQATATEEPQERVNELVTEGEPQVEDAEPQTKGTDGAADAQNTLLSNGDGAAVPPSAVENSELDNAQVQSNEEAEEASKDATHQGNVSDQQQQPSGDSETSSRKIQVPNNKVGVLIGKGGETIRYLQYNSGAKIQIVRDADADLESPLRPVELVGSVESINKAERLIKDVIAEAEAGGSPALIARGVAIAPVTGSTEQIEIKVPNDKVGLIIGKGGETIKSLQTKSGARIQLIPQHPPEGAESKERIVRVTGDKRQIDVAREMIKDAMRQQKPSNLSGGGYPQQPYRPRGPSGPPQWGPRPPYSGQPMAYDYQQRGPYPGPQNNHYGPPPPSYNNYPQQQMPPPRGGGGFGPGWDQRNPNPPPHQAPGPHPGYDFYGGGHAPNPQGPGPHPGPQQPPANYNYGPYPQTGPPQQGYNHGHGFEPPKYDNAPPPAPQYPTSQPMYPQPGQQQGYAQNYGKPPMPYGPQQPYGNPRPDSGYPGYNQAQPQQQPYPYPSTEPVHQQPSYPMYGGSDASGGGHGQGPPPQHQAQPQHHFQPAPGPVSGGYGSYPAPQQGYPEQQQQQQQQPVSQQDGGGYGAPGAAYPAPAQPVYDQSGGYGSVQPASAPQYDSTQQPAYGAPR